MSRALRGSSAVLAAVLLFTVSSPGRSAVPARGAAGPVPVTPADVYEMRTLSGCAISPDGKWIAYSVDQAERDTDSYRGELWIMAADGSEAKKLSREDDYDSTPLFSPDSRRVAWLSDDGSGTQIRVATVGKGKSKLVTAIPEGVDEFDWSPDGKSFVVSRFDPEPAGEKEAEPAGEAAGRKNREEPEEPEEGEPYVVTRMQIQRDGEGFLDTRYTHLWVVPEDGGEPKQITSGAWDDSDPQWSPDGRWIAFVSNRAADPDLTDNTDLYAVQPDGTGLRPLVTRPGPDDAPSWSRRGDRLAFSSIRKPNDYYMRTDQMVVRVAEPGEPLPEPVNLTAALDTWVAGDNYVSGGASHMRALWSPDGGRLALTVEKRGANVLISVPSDRPLTAGEAPLEILGGASVKDLVRSSAAGELVTAVSDALHLPDLQTIPAGGGVPGAVTRLNESFHRDRRFSAPIKVSAKNPDGDTVESWLYPPLDLDPARRYPMIVYIHGGPQGYDGDYFDTGLENQIFPSRGWAVLRVNYRGSTSYGEAFCRAIWGDWHGREFDDLMAATDGALREHAWLDPNRLGMGGWSYGGIMTIWIAGHTDRFKVGVPERFEVDYLSSFGQDQWFLQYLEELGSPIKNEVLYRRLSPVTYIESIKTPLYLIADELDGNCPLPQAMQFYQRLRLLGQKTELVVYPGEAHSMASPRHLEDRLERLQVWFARHLR